MTCERSHEGWDVCWNIVNDDAHIREVETMIEQISTPRMGLAAEFALCRFRYMTQNQFVFWANSRKQHNFAMLFLVYNAFSQSEICVNR